MRFNKEVLAAAVAAAGCAGFAMDVDAADINTNLLVDPGFEDVNATTGAYGSLQLNSWSDGTSAGFTYASGQYDQGGPLSGGGARYFTSNNGGAPNAEAPGVVSQIVDLSSGDTAALIASGLAQAELSGFMTSYAGADIAVLHVEFFDVSDNSLGSFEVQDGDNSTWTFNSITGAIPVGTVTAVVSPYGIPNESGADGYHDNVSFVVSEVPEPGSLALLGLGGLALARRRR